MQSPSLPAVVTAPRPAESEPASRPGWTATSGPSLAIFLISLSINTAAAVAVYLHFNLQPLYLDSVSRSLHAYYALWGHGAPHFAAIGFIWLPLPTVIQLPLALWQPLAISGLAGGLQSALAMAISVVLLERILADLGIGRALRLALLAAFQFHPMMLLYAANGMSESLQVCTLLGSCRFFLRWARRGRVSNLVFMGMSGAAAVMTRYEGFAIVAATVVAMAIVSLREEWPAARVEGEFLAYLVWPVFAFFLWVLFNWMIQGDPLYFYRAPYSAMAQGYFAPEDLRPLVHNPWLTTLFVGERVLAMAPMYLPLAIVLAGRALAARDAESVGLLLLPAAVLAFGWLSHFQGGQFGWFRFFIYAVPGLVLCVGLVPRSGIVPPRSWPLVASAIVIGVFAGLMATGLSMLDPKIGREESRAAQAVMEGKPLDPTDAEDYQVATYIRENIRDKRQILMDDFVGFNIVRLVGGTELFVLTVDTDFRDTLEHPQGRVGWILVPKPESVSSLDAINTMYPGLYEGRLSFVELERDWGKWRLYRLRSQR